MIDVKPEYFGEAQVWESFAQNLPDEVVVYNHREVNGREFDFCILMKDIGLIIIEVKGWQPAHIFDVVGVDEIVISGYQKPERSPKKQARSYRFALLNIINEKYNVSPLIYDMVCYPCISKKEYFEKRLDIISEPEMTIFKEDLKDEISLGSKIANAYNKNKSIPHCNMDKTLFQKIRHHFEPNTTVESNEKDVISMPYSKLLLFNNVISANIKEEIVEEYFQGIKTIFFTSNKQSFVGLVQELEYEFKKRNIDVCGNNLKLEETTYSFDINNENFKIFNFEAYYFPELKDMCELKTMTVIEGNATENEKKVINNIAAESSFNAQQYFIEHASPAKNTLVKAGAGTGKTYSMVSRIAYLCNRHKDSINNIIDDIAMVTFTNDAADNMKSRLKQMFINYFVLTRNPRYLKLIEDVNQMQISSIHKFARGIIQSASLLMGLGNEFSITANDYLKEQIYEKYLNAYIVKKKQENPNFIKELRIPIYRFKKMLMNFANQLYNKSIDIKNIQLEEMGQAIESMPFFNEVIEDVIIEAENEYSNSVVEENKLDLKECMITLNTVVNGSYKDKCDLKLKHLFIDEFQDTDDVQIDSFLKLQEIIGGDCKLFVVGDLKQSIYRFRGATISAFEMLKATKETWDEYTLSTNYRTDSRLLLLYDEIFTYLGKQEYLPFIQTSDSLISSVNARVPEDKLFYKLPFHSKNKDEFFEVLFSELEKQKDIMKALDKENRLSKEEKIIAILVRENWQIDKIVTEAKKRDIYIETKVGGDLYQLTPAMDLYKLMFALNNSTEPVALVNLIDSNYMDIHVDIQGLHSMDYVEKQEEIRDILNQFFELRMSKSWSELIQETHTRTILVVLKEIFEATHPWKQYSKDLDKQKFYRSNYELILEKIIKKFSVDYLTLNIVLNNLKINILTKQSELARNVEEDQEGHRVLCTTIHKAKGLEYGTVILPYTNQAIDNLKKADLDVNYVNSKLGYSIKVDDYKKESNSNYNGSEEVNQRLKEETRVLYVALTRAIRNCIWMQDLDKRNGISWSTLLEE